MAVLAAQPLPEADLKGSHPTNTTSEEAWTPAAQLEQVLRSHWHKGAVLDIARARRTLQLATAQQLATEVCRQFKRYS